MDNLRIHRFSSLSRRFFDSTLSGEVCIKLNIVMLNFGLSDSEVWLGGGLHRLICLATVVSRSWSMSLKWP